MLPLEDNDFTKQIAYVASFVGTDCDDWFRIKKQLLWALHPRFRGLFTKRHNVSRKLFINDFEISLMNYWKTITGVQPRVDETRLHTDADLRMPRHWALMNYNRIKKEKALAKKLDLENND